MLFYNSYHFTKVTPHCLLEYLFKVYIGMLLLLRWQWKACSSTSKLKTTQRKISRVPLHHKRRHHRECQPNSTLRRIASRRRPVLRHFPKTPPRRGVTDYCLLINHCNITDYSGQPSYLIFAEASQI